VARPLKRMTTLDNVVASAFLRAKSKAEAKEMALEMLQFTGLVQDQNVVSKGLPLGKRKKLEITRALVTQPEMLLLDESFAGLNPSEQNVKQTLLVANRGYVLETGKITHQGTGESLLADEHLKTAYLGV